MSKDFILRQWPAPLDAGLLARLAKVEPATIGHYRHDGFLDPAIRAVVPDRRIAGTAVTVSIPGDDSTLLHHALGYVRPGDVVVIDRVGDRRFACWGGALTVAAKAKDIAGVVIDGMATDFGEIRAHDLALWCRGPSPITTRLHVHGGAMNVPVSVGGVVVHPGDAVLADENGIVVLDPGEVAHWCDVALTEQEEEVPFNEDLEKGARLGTLSGATDMIAKAAGIEFDPETGLPR
jgi:regulator of RNase E activity RraA